MMIFKQQLQAETGNLAVPIVIALISIVTAYALLASSVNLMRASAKNSSEAALMLDGHSIAAQFKEMIRHNYEKYYDDSDSTWAACRSPLQSSRSAAEFLKLLAEPGLCANLNFELINFKTFETNPRTSIALSELTGPQLQPNEALNRFSTQIQITAFNPNRLQLIAKLVLSSNSQTLNVNKELSMVIDLERTVTAPVRSATAKICRSVAGAVCEESDFAPSADYRFLSSSGTILNVSVNAATRTLRITDSGLDPAPLAVSLKNLGAGRTEYRNDSFCINALQGTTPIRYIIDAARDSNGNEYFLTTDGRLLRGIDGSEAWETPDPKFLSIAYENGNWLLLQADGTVFKTSSIEIQASLVRIEGLVVRLAEKIAMGLGPAPCP